MYSLNELVELVNLKLNNEGINNLVNDRLIRHYTTVKLVPPAIKEGREARYTDDHVDACVALRQAQSKGLTTKSIKSFQNDTLAVDKNLSDFSILNVLPVESVQKSNLMTTSSNSALSFLQSLDADSMASKSASTQSMSSSRSMLDTLAVASAVGSTVYSTPTFMETKWTSILIRDGLEISVRSDIQTTLTNGDFKKIEMALNQLKK